MKFSYNLLQSFFLEKLPRPEKLAELLMDHFAEVEEIKKVGQDFLLDIDLKPNRVSDSSSHLGVAREISAITGLKLKRPSLLVNYSQEKTKNFISLEVKEKEACSRYTAQVIKEVKVAPSPKWLQEKLITCGLKPINNIVDITNYVMLEIGQPLHAFDLEKIEEGKVIVRFAKKGEKIITLDGEEFELNSVNLLIADKKKPLALAGIKGGKLPEIDKQTKTIVLEAANFDSKITRYSSQKLKLRTDASIRFEHGLDLNLTELALKRATHLIEKIVQGKASQGIIDFYPKKVLIKKIELNLNYVRDLLGVEISEKEIIKILKSLEFGLKKKKKDVYEVIVPSHRLDISLQEDLVEEIGRIYGYEKIPVKIPCVSLTPLKENLSVYWENLAKDVLKELGLTEIYNYSFLSQKEVDFFAYQEKELIKLKNPLSSEYQYLRISLIPNLLKNVEKNFRDFSEIRIFELGKVFKRPAVEGRRLAGLVLDREFQYLKGIIDLFLKRLGGELISYHSCPKIKESAFSLNRSALIKINGEEVGYLGEVSSKVLTNFGIKKKIVLFDLDFEKLLCLTSKECSYCPFSRFPSATRDIALLVPEKVRVAEILSQIYQVDKLVHQVDLFDIYQGKELPSGKKNLAFRIVYQAEDRTLTAEEINQLQNKVIKVLEKKPEWQIRK